MTAKADPQRALFLNRLQGPLPSGYSRLYFGSEFCSWAFPSRGEVLSALHAAREAAWTFTLALPVLPEPHIPRLRHLLQAVAPLLHPGDEIMVSDLGEISLAQEVCPSTTIILGRVLSGQKRGPQIVDLRLTDEQLSYFRQGSWYGAEARAFLRERGICRIELDNLLQGITPLPKAFAGSLHLPYAMVASSRNCPFRTPGSDGCDRSCGDVFTLSSSDSSVPLFQGGNTQFLRNETIPLHLDRLGIDRIVVHPHLPR